jgi:hypothetical protein
MSRGRRGDPNRETEHIGLDQPVLDPHSGLDLGLDLITSRSPSVIEPRVEASSNPQLEFGPWIK